MKTLKRLIEAHKFFIRESPGYVVGYHDPRAPRDGRAEEDALARMRFYESYYYVAYIKFMWLSLADRLPTSSK